MYKIKIYQLPNKKFAEATFDVYLNKNNSNLTKSDYIEVYECEREYCSDRIYPAYILNYIFEEFNIKIPKDFNGHSLSVTDVIKVNNEYYMVMPTGFKNVNEMFNK